MDPRLIVILAAAFVAMAGYICLSPDQFGFLRLPQAFLQLGMERTVTGLALMLLGFLVALSEAEGEARPGRARGARPFAFGGEDPAPATGELRLEPEPHPQTPPTPEHPASLRRPDLYEDLEEEPAAVPKSDSPPPP
jgi:hypothetical protein